MKNIKLIERISILGLIVFLVGSFIYKIKCPTRIIVLESPLTIQYPEGSVLFWEFQYMVIYYLILSLVFCIINLIQTKWVKRVLWLFFLYISLNIVRSITTIYQEISNLQYKSYSIFWLLLSLGLIFFIVIAIKYIKKK